MKVKFNEKLHQYNDENGIYLSVTQLLSLYKTGFDKEYQAKKYVQNHPEFPMSVDQCLFAWDFLCDIALDKGNKYHNRKELENLWLVSKLEKDYIDELESLYDLPNNVYPELRLYNDQYRIAGHADRVDVDGKFVDIEDYKTYKEPIAKKGFKGQMMKYPLSKIPDANYYHAALQMMIYGWLLEGFGYTVRSLKIHHKQFDDDEDIPDKYFIPFVSEVEQRKPKIYQIKYNKKLVVTLLEHYATSKRTNRQTTIIY